MSDSKLSCSCEVGGYVCLCVCLGVEEGGGGGGLGKKKTLSLTPDDIFGSTSKASRGGRERGVQATDRAPLLLALLPKKICASLWLCVSLCVLCMCVLGGWCVSFFFFFYTNRQGVYENKQRQRSS